MGWYKQDGVEVELVALAGSGDCVKTTATREIPFSLPSVEPLAAARAQGVKAKIFYTAYQGNIYGIAVPADSPIQKITDLKGKTVGVISMGSGGVPAAKALIATAGMNPESDVNIVVAGEGAQTAAMLRSKQVDALSQFDTQYAMVENAGVRAPRKRSARAGRMPLGSREATPKVRFSPSTIPRLLSASSMRSFQSSSRPEKMRPRR